MKGFDIIINAALKDNPVATLLGELGVETRFISLKQGEFVLSPETGIKYMTRGNFLAGVQNRSIYRDIIEFGREFSQPVIIVEGSQTSSEPGMDITQLHTAILFISIMNRIPVIFTANDIESAQLIFMMSAQATSGLDLNGATKTGPEKGKTAKTNGDLRQLIIESIPDVGPALAKALLKHFGSLSRLFSSNPKDLQRVEGVGPKRARSIYKFFKSKAA
jgi:ERCC4-type nuclease